MLKQIFPLYQTFIQKHKSNEAKLQLLVVTVNIRHLPDIEQNPGENGNII